jgi:hypothetical protein
MKKVAMVSLGCPKNQVDAEVMLKSLSDAGFAIGVEESEADAIIINTCTSVCFGQFINLNCKIHNQIFHTDGIKSFFHFHIPHPPIYIF